MGLLIRNGKIVFSRGAIVHTNDPSKCKCCNGESSDSSESSEPRICCFNNQCEIVPCDSPDVIGSVPGCDPCELDFCGYCRPGSNTSVPINLSRDPAQSYSEDWEICPFVETDSMTLTSRIEALTHRQNNSGTLVTSITQEGIRTSLTAFSGFASGGSLVTVDADAAVGSTDDTNTAISTIAPGGVPYIATTSQVVSNIVRTKIGPCEFRTTYDVAFTVRLEIPSIGFDETETDNLSFFATRTFAACSDELITFDITTNPIGNITGGNVTLQVTQKPFVQTEPTCIS